MLAALRAILFALSLLGAQQIALAHAIGHLDASQSQQDKDKRLCDLHSAMGSVLGALDTAPLCLSSESPDAPRFDVPAFDPPGLPSPSPASRGPPAVSLK